MVSYLTASRPHQWTWIVSCSSRRKVSFDGWVGWGILYVVVVLLGYVTLLVYLCLSLYT